MKTTRSEYQEGYTAGRIDQAEEDKAFDPNAKTLRDEFAMAALPTIIAGAKRDIESGGVPAKWLALLAYRMADKMMKAREKKND